MRFHKFLQFFYQISFCAVLILFASACSDDESFTGTLQTPFALTGTASATTTDGTTVNCELDLVFELTPTGTANQYEGIYRGLLKRTVQTRDGKGFSFSMNPNGSAEARLIIPNIARIEVPANGITSNSRFLQQLREFVATMDNEGRGSGTWTCSPLDTTLNGFNDNLLNAGGQFIVQPIP